MTTSTSNNRGHRHWGDRSVLELRACCKHVCPLGPARLRLEGSNEKTGALLVSGREDPLWHCRRARSDLPGTKIPQSPPLTSQKWKPAIENLRQVTERYQLPAEVLNGVGLQNLISRLVVHNTVYSGVCCHPLGSFWIGN